MEQWNQESSPSIKKWQLLFCHQDDGSNRLGINETNIKDKPQT